MSNATRLAAAGVRIAFHQDDPVTSTKWLRFNGGLAMRYGLPEKIALAGGTIDAARSRGFAKPSWKFDGGKDADLVVRDGACYSYSVGVDLVFVDGVLAYDRSRDENES